MSPRSHRLRNHFSRLVEALRSPLERFSDPGEGYPSAHPLNLLSRLPSGSQGIYRPPINSRADQTTEDMS
jgi:hypothetical protein